MILVSMDRLWNTERKQKWEKHVYTYWYLSACKRPLPFNVAFPFLGLKSWTYSKYHITSISKVSPSKLACYIFQKLTYQINRSLKNTQKMNVSTQCFPSHLTIVFLLAPLHVGLLTANLCCQFCFCTIY